MKKKLSENHTRLKQVQRDMCLIFEKITAKTQRKLFETTDNKGAKALDKFSVTTRKTLYNQ